MFEETKSLWSPEVGVQSSGGPTQWVLGIKCGFFQPLQGILNLVMHKVRYHKKFVISLCWKWVQEKEEKLTPHSHSHFFVSSLVFFLLDVYWVIYNIFMGPQNAGPWSLSKSNVAYWFILYSRKITEHHMGSRYFLVACVSQVFRRHSGCSKGVCI